MVDVCARVLVIEKKCIVKYIENYINNRRLYMYVYVIYNVIV